MDSSATLSGMPDSLCPNEHTITLDPATATLTILCGEEVLGSLVGARNDNEAGWWQQMTMLRHERDLLRDQVGALGERLEELQQLGDAMGEWCLDAHTLKAWKAARRR